VGWIILRPAAPSDAVLDETPAVTEAKIKAILKRARIEAKAAAGTP
jgi:hypothetical protein